MSTLNESDHEEFNMEDFKKRQRAAKIQDALDALKMATPGDWWIDDRGDIHNDPVGTFCIGMVGDGAALWYASNRKVIAASREMAEEVLQLRKLLANAGIVVSGLVDGKDMSKEISRIASACEEHNVPTLTVLDLVLASGAVE